MSNTDFTKSSSPKDSDFFHASLNPTAKETIVLIHGAFGNGDDWDLVTPFLSDYHILIPDLTGHGRNLHLKPFSLRKSASLIRDIIQAHAKNGKAHIAGLSLGAHVGLYLSITFPEVVDSVVLSGFSSPSLGKNKNSKSSTLSSWMPYLFYIEQRIENCIPRSLTRWLMDGTDLRGADLDTLTPSTCRDVLNALNTENYTSPWPARTLIIAATKSGAVPSFDSPERTAELAALGRLKNAATMGVVHRGMRHPWCRQDPKLFAETVKAWVEGREIPSGFEKIR